VWAGALEGSPTTVREPDSFVAGGRMAAVTLQRLREAVREVVKGQRFHEAAGGVRASHVGRVLEEELFKNLGKELDKK